MKKHLRGKRYIRSRSNVAVGRINRRAYKLTRWLEALGRVDWVAITENISKTFAMMVEMANTASRNIRARNS